MLMITALGPVEAAGLVVGAGEEVPLPPYCYHYY